MQVGAEGETDFTPLENTLYGRELEFKNTRGPDPVEAIIAESKLGFGVIGLGAEDQGIGDEVVSPLVDGVLSQSDVPVVVVRRGRNLERDLPAAFTRILVPVGRSESSRAAQELAFNISSNLGTDVQLAHVLDEEHHSLLPRIFHRPGSPVSTDATVADALLGQAMQQAEELGVSATSNVIAGSSTSGELIDFVEREEVDLVIIGATLRRLDDHPSLGPVVNQMLRDCDATVVVVSVPIDI